VYLASGIMRVPFRRFIVFDLICATTVIGTFFGLSYFLSERYGDSIYHWIHDAEMTVTAVVVVGLVIAALWWWRRHRRSAVDSRQ
jgi:membrane protein DedA with SNARE-associated domain